MFHNDIAVIDERFEKDQELTSWLPRSGLQMSVHHDTDDLARASSFTHDEVGITSVLS